MLNTSEDQKKTQWSKIMSQEKHALDISVEQNKNNTTRPVSHEVGSNILSGVFISYTTFILEALKKRAQQRDPTIKFKPWRGSTIFAANIVPTTTIHLTLNSFFKQYLSADAPIVQQIMASAACGVIGASTATVVENVITRQQILQCGPMRAILDMGKHSLLRPWKSYPQIATRDGIFTAWLFTVNPAIIQYAKNTLVNDSSSEKYEERVTMAAATFAALVGAGITHPFDTAGTWLQRTHLKDNFLAAARVLYGGAWISPAGIPFPNNGHGFVIDRGTIKFVKDGAFVSEGGEARTLQVIEQHKKRFPVGIVNPDKVIFARDNPLLQKFMTEVCMLDEVLTGSKVSSPIAKETGGFGRFYAGFPYRFGLFLVFSNLIPEAKKVFDDKIDRYFGTGNANNRHRLGFHPKQDTQIIEAEHENDISARNSKGFRAGQ